MASLPHQPRDLYLINDEQVVVQACNYEPEIELANRIHAFERCFVQVPVEFFFSSVTLVRTDLRLKRTVSLGR